MDPALPTPFGDIARQPDAWHARAEPEPVLEPALPIVDAHHHLWDRPGWRYLLPEFAQDIDDCGHNVVATVYNECNSMYRAHGPQHLKPVGEVEFCTGMGAMSDSGIYGPARVCAGVVGYADLLDAHLDETLDALQRAGGGRLRGLRCRASWDPDPAIVGIHGNCGPGLYLQPELQAAVRKLRQHGLGFDAQVLHPQLGDVAQLARACPDTQIVLLHTGVPVLFGSYAGREEEVFAQWRAGMAELAACNNVSVKLGGLVIRNAKYDYGKSERPLESEHLAQHWRPWLATTVELFGPARCMVESNFPVDSVGVGYAALWNTFKRVFAHHTPDEKLALFGGTAAGVYRLALPPSPPASGTGP